METLFGVLIETLTFDSQPTQHRLIALRYGDHLLRRFGLAEVIEAPDGKSPHLLLRPEADEVWVLLKGAITLDLLDRRSDSPTRGQSQSVELQAPSRVLIPFGVAAGWRTISGPVQILRLTTHSEEESAVEHIAWEER
jgi:hypothetical protein